jgi:hypothetical protein
MMPLQAYELWQDTGSQQAYQLICALSDAVPGQAAEAPNLPLAPLH